MLIYRVSLETHVRNQKVPVKFACNYSNCCFNTDIVLMKMEKNMVEFFELKTEAQSFVSLSVPDMRSIFEKLNLLSCHLEKLCRHPLTCPLCIPTRLSCISSVISENVLRLYFYHLHVWSEQFLAVVTGELGFDNYLNNK